MKIKYFYSWQFFESLKTAKKMSCHRILGQGYWIRIWKRTKTHENGNDNNFIKVNNNMIE